MATKSRTGSPRAPLSKERVLEAALVLADESGIESLTMRNLGRKLGVEAMSLYNHVSNKDDILAGICDLVLAEIAPPAADGDWDTALRASAVSAHDALRRHPWACSLLMSAERVLTARLRYMDSLLERLREAGFSAETTYHAYHVLDAHIFGFSLWQAGHSFKAEDLQDLAATFLEKFPLDDYPHVAEHVEQHLTDGPLHDVSAFEFGLDLIFDGLRKLRGTA